MAKGKKDGKRPRWRKTVTSGGVAGRVRKRRRGLPWLRSQAGNSFTSEARTHLPLFTGSMYYVDADQADDSGDGTSPTTAKRTITAGLALLSAGDALKVKAGTYNESGMVLNQTASELILEAGTILQDSGNGTVLTVSAFGCVVRGDGNVRIDPTGGATGILISGGFGWLFNLRVNCNDAGAIGYDITGAGAELIDCRCASPTTAAFKVHPHPLCHIR